MGIVVNPPVARAGPGEGLGSTAERRPTLRWSTNALNCCCTCVSQGEVAFIERCGQFNRAAEPGCSCLWPCCCERVAGVVSLRLQQLEVTCETKTHDNVFITLVVSVQYQALEGNIVETFYRLSNPHEQIRAYVEDVVRSAVPGIHLDDVFEQKDHIAKTIGESLEKTMA